jgi:hypothetical protein
MALYNSKECLFLKRFTMQDTSCRNERIKSGDMTDMQYGNVLPTPAQVQKRQ